MAPKHVVQSYNVVMKTQKMEGRQLKNTLVERTNVDLNMEEVGAQEHVFQIVQPIVRIIELGVK